MTVISVFDCIYNHSVMQALHDKLVREDRQIVIAIEGNIGSGKSTLIDRIKAAHPDLVETIPEPIDTWQDCAGFNMLECFYEDPTKYAYMFQSFAIVTRIMKMMATLAATDKRIIIVERSPFSDELFVRQCVDQGYMNEIEYAAYRKWRDYLWEQPKKLITGLLYLRVSPETCFERMQKRDRDEECSVTLSYLRNLHCLHENWLVSASTFVEPEGYADKPCAMIEENIVNDPKCVDMIAGVMDLLKTDNDFIEFDKMKNDSQADNGTETRSQ